MPSIRICPQPIEHMNRNELFAVLHFGAAVICCIGAVISFVEEIRFIGWLWVAVGTVCLYTGASYFRKHKEDNEQE